MSTTVYISCVMCNPKDILALYQIAEGKSLTAI